MASKVLIVEADQEFRLHLAKMLSRRDFLVMAVGDADEALDLVVKEGIKAILLGLSGLRRQALEFLKRVGEQSPGSRVVLINRAGDVSLSIEAMKLGAFGEVNLPVDLERLESKIRACLEDDSAGMS